MSTIIGLLFVISGFIISITEKRIRKSKNGLTQAFVNKVEKNGDEYQIYLTYIANDKNEQEEVIINTKRNLQKQYVLLSHTEDGYKLYSGTKKALISSMACWILGIIILLI